MEKALARIFPLPKEEELNVPEKPQTPPAQPPANQPIAEADTVAELIILANDTFNQAQEAMKAGNWALYGDKINELQGILQKLNSLGGALVQ